MHGEGTVDESRNAWGEKGYGRCKHLNGNEKLDPLCFARHENVSYHTGRMDNNNGGGGGRMSCEGGGGGGGNHEGVEPKLCRSGSKATSESLGSG